MYIGPDACTYFGPDASPIFGIFFGLDIHLLNQLFHLKSIDIAFLRI